MKLERVLSWCSVTALLFCGCSLTMLERFPLKHLKHKHQPQITAVSANPCEPEGIPYYLPKPLLIVAKNFDYVEGTSFGDGREATIPNSFDGQAGFGSVSVNFSDMPGTPSPAADAAKKATGANQSGISDVVQSVTGAPLAGPVGTGSYTCRIVFVPDLSQKYFLRVTGGPGEIRAALNLVNGWMFTGPGGYYQKDSSSAQNTMAWGAALKLGGSGAADVINSLGGLTKSSEGEQAGLGLDSGEMIQFSYQFNKTMSENGEPFDIKDYAEVVIYEQDLSSGIPQWVPVVTKGFDATSYGYQTLENVTVSKPKADAPGSEPEPAGNPPAGNPPAGNPPAGGSPNPEMPANEFIPKPANRRGAANEVQDRQQFLQSGYSTDINWSTSPIIQPNIDDYTQREINDRLSVREVEPSPVREFFNGFHHDQPVVINSTAPSNLETTIKRPYVNNEEYGRYYSDERTVQ